VGYTDTKVAVKFERHASIFNTRLRALRFVFEVTCGREEMVRDLPLRRLPQTLPTVLSQEEMAALLKAAPGPGLNWATPSRPRNPRRGQKPPVPPLCRRRLPTTGGRATSVAADTTSTTKASAPRLRASPPSGAAPTAAARSRASAALSPCEPQAGRACPMARDVNNERPPAICPKLGKGAAPVLPRCNTAAMNLHLQEVAAAVAPFVGGTIHRIVPSSSSPHAVLLLDQAGWHVSAKLAVPPNITLMPLPPKAPELNPVENLWQFIRDNWLSNRIFRSYDGILDHACAAWRRIVDQPWRIMTIGLREWAHGS